MIGQGFNYVDYTVKEMTDFYKTRVENLEPKEEEKESSAAAKKSHNRSATKRKQEDSDSSVIESSKETSIERRSNRKYCISYGKCSHSTGNCKDLRTMFNKHKQKKRGDSRHTKKNQGTQSCN